jgi:hypothetical protein
LALEVQVQGSPFLKKAVQVQVRAKMARTLSEPDHRQSTGYHYHHHKKPGAAEAQYKRQLELVLSAANNTHFRQLWKDTGISRLSIFSSFHVDLPIPSIFPSNVMHLSLFGLNIPEIILLLYQGTVLCELDDNCSTWDWAVLQGPAWEQHGKIAEAFCQGYFTMLKMRQARSSPNNRHL